MQPKPFVQVLSVAAFAPSQQSWVVATQTVWPTKLTIFVTWPSEEKIADDCCHFNCNLMGQKHTLNHCHCWSTKTVWNSKCFYCLEVVCCAAIDNKYIALISLWQLTRKSKLMFLYLVLGRGMQGAGGWKGKMDVNWNLQGSTEAPREGLGCILVTSWLQASTRDDEAIL